MPKSLSFLDGLLASAQYGYTQNKETLIKVLKGSEKMKKNVGITDDAACTFDQGFLF